MRELEGALLCSLLTSSKIELLLTIIVFGGERVFNIKSGFHF